ncbi:hypothetical protein [Schleiferilactobacillus harbinensis]|uniref:hypothetical protein n=1 Tax=Schleiferilactobacillus harbinensis TaxID=304207 RepID=UPI0007BA2DD6|nr:hypothetical protein [Schleiferilactobacillus harbinensis]
MLAKTAIIILLILLVLLSIIARLIVVRLLTTTPDSAMLRAIIPALRRATMILLFIALVGAMILLNAPLMWNLVTVALTLLYMLALIFHLARLLKK